MKHRAFTIWEALVVIAIVAIGVAILFPPGSRSRENARRSSCQSNLKQIAIGIKQYQGDFDDKFPPTRNAAGAWGALIFPYVKADAIFHCPSDRSGGAPKTTDYFYNAHLAGVRAKNLNFAALTISMGDGMGDQTLDAHLMQLPNAWRTDENSPAWRHLDGANYGFADGHVKWFKPVKVTLDKPSVNRPTFLLGPVMGASPSQSGLVAWRSQGSSSSNQGTGRDADWKRAQVPL